MIRWLHISDLHIRDKADWSNFKEELIEKCKKIGKIDFIVVTGDFHDYSDLNNFQPAADFLKKLVNELDLNISQDLFLVPGNHDGVTFIDDKNIFIKAVKAEPLDIGDCLEHLLGMFRDYESFVKALIPDYPAKHPAAIHTRVWNNQISLIHCNTAIGADGKTKENQVLDIDGLSGLKPDGALPALILAHNNFEDMHKSQQNRIRDYIRVHHICAYLCGDTHKNDVTQISYADNQNRQIPCVISYKASPDPKDEYSRFGMIVGEWEKQHATLKGWSWQSGHGFKTDNIIDEKTIDMRREPGFVPSPVKNIRKYQLPPEFKGWKRIDQKVKEQKPKDIILSMERFLKGYPCTWALACSDLPVLRQQTNELKLKIQEGGIIALLGAGAEGKSTILKQLSVQLHDEGYVVLFHNERMEYELPDNLPDNTVLIVDDPDDYDFIKFMSQVHDSGITLVFAARRNEWNLLCNRNNISSDVKRSITELVMAKITEYEEAKAFADCVIKYYRPDAKEEQLIRVFLHNSEEFGFLYAAMLLSIHDKTKFEEIAQDIIKNIKESSFKSLKLLAYAVLAEHAGITLSEQQYQYLLKKLNLNPKEAKEALDLELQHKGNRRVTRHKNISNLFYCTLFGENGEFNAIDADTMRYELLDFLLIEYTKCLGKKNERNNLIEDIISCTILINEAQDTDDMFQRVIEVLRQNISVLQKVGSRMADHQLLGEKCYKSNVICSPIMFRWAKGRKQLDGAGDYTRENSALWIYREVCINRNVSDSGMWLAWAQTEKETNGAGGYTNENSALWIYHEACVRRKVPGTDVWLGWAQTEKETNGAGGYTKENSALWIYREACVNRKVSGTDIWMGWAQTEKETNGAGSYSKENSTLWIYREACVNRKVSSADIWLAWAQTEKETNGAGSYTKENSALWIYHEAWNNRKACDSSLLLGWAQTEKEINGAGGYTKENSALWIYREACVNRKGSDSDTWLGWAQTEKETNGAGGYTEENSALWIYHEACVNRKVLSSSIWLSWAQTENEANGAGAYTKENSALWVYREACVNRKVSGTDIWLGWAQTEKETNGAGVYTRENSALWIYHEACINRKASDAGIWLGWTQLAERNSVDNTGWNPVSIYNAALDATNWQRQILIAYVRYLICNHYFGEARKLAREMLDYDYGVISSIMIIEMIAGNIDEDNKYSVNNLRKLMEKRADYSLGAQYGLYIYHRLLNNKPEENKYYAMLDFSMEHVRVYVEAMEQFLADCKKAYEHSLESANFI